MIADDLTLGDGDCLIFGQGHAAIILGRAALAGSAFAGSSFCRDVLIVHGPKVPAHGGGNGYLSSAVVDAEIGHIGGEVEGTAGGGAAQRTAHVARHEQERSAARIHLPRRPRPIEKGFAREVPVELVQHLPTQVGKNVFN